MRPNRVVVAPPSLDQDLGFAQCVENLAVQQFFSKAGIEARIAP
jgi:hypothetical protein